MDHKISPGWATYLRVSDEDKQTPERSFAMQRQRIQENLLSPSDIPFLHEYCDVLTGTSPNRIDYQKMLADAEGGVFSHLGLYRADRFGRNTIEGLQAATKLIGLGIKIRVAHMPSLRPEDPDGFFMFLIQMGLAQREVDVLKLRTADGMEAKLRAGGWAHKAPEGYLNKERQIASNKYERWVEPDPETIQVIREAWNLLLADQYSLDDICEELTMRGFTRSDGRPWVWIEPKTNTRMNAKYMLHRIFHNPFYAGWVVSKRFGIPMGEVRGHWEPIVTTEEFHRGVEIMRKHDLEKSREYEHVYILRNLLWVDEQGKQFKMHGSSPKPRAKLYAYYITHSKPMGKKIHIPCEAVDQQIPDWLSRIGIEPLLMASVKHVYETHIQQNVEKGRDGDTSKLKAQLSQLCNEETQLGRLFITGKIGEQAYEQLRLEWKEKVWNIEKKLSDMERDTQSFLNDLDVALMLFSKASDLYERLENKKKTVLLQILTKRIIVNSQGKIIDQELHSPFAYLQQVKNTLLAPELDANSSKHVDLGTPSATRTHASASGGQRSIL